jgi:hypothetical protein
MYPSMIIPFTKWGLMRQHYGIHALIKGYVIPPQEDGPVCLACHDWMKGDSF